MIKAVIFDIDGVITDGKIYTDGQSEIYKTLALKDLDALIELKKMGYILGAITGEDNTFTDYLKKEFSIDYFIHSKDKKSRLLELMHKESLCPEEIVYVGDGKYDIPVIEYVEWSMCPSDAAGEVKERAKIILATKGGEGCIAEVCKWIKDFGQDHADAADADKRVWEICREHSQLAGEICQDMCFQSRIVQAVQCICKAYKEGHKLLICGNGGSAADAQHIAAELVSRFYLERPGLSAEALTTDTSILTAVANDYDFANVFERQVEAKGKPGDVLWGITTSGRSANITAVLKQARRMGMKTILSTGKLQQENPVRQYTDVAIEVPCKDTPRIQEIHILAAHIICEMVEQALTDENGRRKEDGKRTCFCDRRDWDQP